MTVAPHDLDHTKGLLLRFLRFFLLLSLSQRRATFAMRQGSSLPPYGDLRGAVVFDTSMGPIAVATYAVDCPRTAENFIRLCMSGYYNGCRVHRVIRDRVAELWGHDDCPCVTAESLFGEKAVATSIPLEVSNQVEGINLQEGSRRRLVKRRLRIDREGLLLALPDSDTGAPATTCNWAVTLNVTKPLDFLERRVTVFGEVIHGFDVLRQLSATSLRCGSAAGTHISDGTPARIFRIHRAYIIDGNGVTPPPPTFSFTAHLQSVRTAAVDLSPCAIRLDAAHTAEPQYDEAETFGALASDDDTLSAVLSEGTAQGPAAAAFARHVDTTSNNAIDTETRALMAAAQLAQRTRVAQTRTLMMQLLGHLPPDAGATQPPRNVLFVCRLNPVTSAEDLATVFRRFGHVLSCDIITDPRTKRSLQYGFVEFADEKACLRAFLKMNDVLVDDCRVHVDFCQSVTGIYWSRQNRTAKRSTPQQAIRPPQPPQPAARK